MGAALEQTEIAFEVMLGSAEKAQKTLKELYDFADKTPFDTDQVVQAGRKLLAFGINADEIGEKLQKLGDIAASFDDRDIGGLATIFGKITAMGKAQAEELQQLTDRGVPILTTLAEMYGVTSQEILDMGSKGQITAEVIDAAFSKMTGAGGLYEGMMERIADTLGGKASTAMSKWKTAVAKAGKALGAILKPALTAVIGIMNFLGDTGMTIVAGVATAFSAFAAAAGAAKLAMVLLGKTVVVKMKVIAAAMLTNPIGQFLLATGLAVALVIKYLDEVVIGLKVFWGYLKLAYNVWKDFSTLNWSGMFSRAREGIKEIHEGAAKDMEDLTKKKEEENKKRQEQEKKHQKAIQKIKDTIAKQLRTGRKRKKREINLDSYLDDPQLSVDAVDDKYDLEAQERRFEQRINSTISYANQAKGIYDNILQYQINADQEAVNNYIRAQQEKLDALKESQRKELEAFKEKEEEQLQASKDAFEREQEQRAAEFEIELEGHIDEAEAKGATDAELLVLEEALRQKETASINKELADRARFEITETKRSNDRVEALEKQHDEKLEAQKKEAAMTAHARQVDIFNKQKKAKKVDTILNTASGIMQIYADSTIPSIWVKHLQAGLLGTTGATQLALIDQQPAPEPPSFRMGGVIRSNAAGGVDTIDARVSAGESIVDRERTDRLFNFLDRLNAGQAGGVSINIEGNMVGNEEFIEDLSEALARHVEGNEGI